MFDTNPKIPIKLAMHFLCVVKKHENKKIRGFRWKFKIRHGWHLEITAPRYIRNKFKFMQCCEISRQMFDNCYNHKIYRLGCIVVIEKENCKVLIEWKDWMMIFEESDAQTQKMAFEKHSILFLSNNYYSHPIRKFLAVCTMYMCHAPPYGTGMFNM